MNSQKQGNVAGYQAVNQSISKDDVYNEKINYILFHLHNMIVFVTALQFTIIAWASTSNTLCSTLEILKSHLST